MLTTILDEFQAENPNIKIELDEVPNADILTKLTAYSEADDLPDIIDGQFGLASFINLDAAMDITQYVQDQGLEESFIPVALTAGKDSEGRILGLPFYTGTDALYYRTRPLRRGWPGPERSPHDLGRAEGVCDCADQSARGPLWIRHVWQDAHGALHSLHAEQRTGRRHAAARG